MDWASIAKRSRIGALSAALEAVDLVIARGTAEFFPVNQAANEWRSNGGPTSGEGA